MTIPIDSITNRKLVLVKQLYQQANKSSDLQYSLSNRIMSVIGFDLAVETLLKMVVGVFDQQKQPSDNFAALFGQCDNLLNGQNLPPLPYRTHILHVHSIRNDAQHKAKYPNETDINDSRIYVRDFCREVISNIWGISFDELSPLEWIDDKTLKELLEISLADIKSQDYKKALTLTAMAFSWASGSILNFLPEGADGLYGGQVPELADTTVEYINAVLKNIENNAKHYAALMSSGINVVDYKRFRETSPFLNFIFSGSILSSENAKREWSINIYWRNKKINEEEALWVHSFVVNSIINWQSLGLAPSMQNEYKQRQAQMLINWDNNLINVFNM